MPSFHDFTLNSITGSPLPLSTFRGKVVLAVNVASYCGYTPHYKGMQALYEKYRAQGLEVLGFPANDFAEEEPGTDQDIAKFCQSKYHVTFPMFAKIHVIGPDIHPLYRWLSEQPPHPGPVEWNFGKFVIGRDGQVTARFNPKVKPEAGEVVAAVEKELAGT